MNVRFNGLEKNTAHVIPRLAPFNARMTASD